MATKIKKIYKGIKYITHIFVVKEEREIEIGLPTDVKHIAHIGSDGASGHPPSWINEFKSKTKDHPATANTIVNAKIEETTKESNSATWSSEGSSYDKDFESPESIDRRRQLPAAEIFDVTPTRDIPIPKKKKKKRKKSKSKSMSMASPNSNTTTTRRVAPKSKTKLVMEGNANARPESIQVI